MVQAEPVFSYGGHGGGGTFIDAEQFVYYDGLMKPLAFLKARRTAAGDLVLDNTAPYPLHDLWCVVHTGDPRTGKAPRLARVSLVAIWQPGFFHAPGLTLFYRLPQREYDRVTTIALDPVPETLVRVGIVLHAHAEPERVSGAKQPDSEARSAEPVEPAGPAIRPRRLDSVELARCPRRPTCPGGGGPFPR